MIHAEDSQFINPAEFANKVVSGMVLETSIVLRPQTSFEDNEEKCPRCGHINRNVTAHCGWIEWKVPLDSITLHQLTSLIAVANVLGNFKSRKLITMREILREGAMKRLVREVRKKIMQAIMIPCTLLYFSLLH
jgi:hypothetical protein